MKRLTKRNENGLAYYPECFRGKCGGKGCENLNDCQFDIDVCKKLASYEDTEAQGLLVRLPCKVGDTVFEPTKRGYISTYKIISVHLSNCSTLIGWRLIDGVYSSLKGFEISALGKTVFLNRQEAEKALEAIK